MSAEFSIIIGGDTVPTKSNEEYLVNGLEAKVFNKVKDTLLSTDVVIVNLECPLTHSEKNIKKAGPCLKARPETIKGLVEAGIDIFSLANNHIMDFGPEGLSETVKTIQGKQATYIGAGENLASARQILTMTNKGYKFAIISTAEHEFSIAEENLPGANPFDPFDTIEDIKQARAEVDYVIVLYHGGIEHYEYPSPNLQRICRKMVESGADCVICQHSHCIGSYEKYLDRHIVYGQGNLLFDHDEDEMWQTGLLLQITLENSCGGLEFIPIVKKGYAIDLAEGEDKERILKAFKKRNLSVTDGLFVQKEWLEFVKRRKYYYLQTFLGFGNLVKRVDNRLGNIISKSLYNRTINTRLYNYINCEAHLEVIKSALKEDYLKKD